MPSSAYVAGEMVAMRLHPLREHLDRVVDAGDDEQRPLGDEAELRPLLGRDEREDGHHHPDADERDRRHEEHDERGEVVRIGVDRSKKTKAQTAYRNSARISP